MSAEEPPTDAGAGFTPAPESEPAPAEETAPAEPEPEPFGPDTGLSALAPFALELGRILRAAVICAVIGVVAAELILRACGLPTGAQASMRQVYDVEDATLGVFQANSDMFMGWPPEFPYQCDFNSLGCRGDEPRASEQPPLLCIGDSLTFGWGVQNDETWPALLDAKLAAAGKPRAVVNLSSGHLVIEDELRYLTRAMEELKPSHVILLAPGQGYIDPLDRLDVTAHQRSKKRERKRRQANPVRLLYRKTALYEAQYFSKEYRKRLAQIGRGILPMVNTFEEEELKKLRARYTEKLLKFKAQVEAGGATFVLAVFPEMVVERDANGPKVTYVDPWVATMAKEQGIPCLDVTPRFRDDPNPQGLLQLPYDLHATKPGNQHIADVVFEELTR